MPRLSGVCGNGTYRKADVDTKASDQTKNKEEFETMKKKTRNILLGMIAAVVAAVAGIAIFKATR